MACWQSSGFALHAVAVGGAAKVTWGEVCAVRCLCGVKCLAWHAVAPAPGTAGVALDVSISLLASVRPLIPMALRLRANDALPFDANLKPERPQGQPALAPKARPL